MIALVSFSCSKVIPTPTTTSKAPLSASQSVPVNPIKIRFGYTQPKGSAQAIGWQWWAEEVQKQTEGRLIFELYPDGILYGEPGSIDAVKSQLVDIGTIAASSHIKDFPLSNVAGLPMMGFPDTAEGNLAAGNAVFTLIDKFTELKAQFQNFKLLSVNVTPNRTLVIKSKEVHLPSELNGLRIGGSGSTLDFAVLNGAAKVSVAPPDSYLSLDKGVIDGFFCTKGQWHDYHLYEVAKYFIDYTFGQGVIVTAMNLDSWKKIPERDQKIMMDLMSEARKISAKSEVDGINKGVQEVKDSGKKIITLTSTEKAAWQKSAEIFWDSWIQEMNGSGFKSQKEILNEWKDLGNKATK